MPQPEGFRLGRRHATYSGKRDVTSANARHGSAYDHITWAGYRRLYVVYAQI
ncbi:MAG: hypothetical protein ACJAST_003642 [Halopseudomonas sp.]|jgi:hypothetical protein